MPQVAISFDVIFNRTLAIPEIQIADTTNYTGAVPPYNFLVDSTMQGFISVFYNTGSGFLPIYDNVNGVTPDVLPDGVSPGSVAYVGPTLVLPLGTNGLPLPAEYQFSYRVVYNPDVNILPNPNAGTSTIVKTFTYNLVDPVPCLEVAVNCLASSLSSTDDTVYDIQGTTYTIVRQHTLYPPPASGASVMSGNLQTLVYSPIITQTWTAELISTVTYSVSNGIFVILTVEALKEFNVNCDTNLSNILCCLINVQKEYEAMECVNPVKAEIIKSSRLDPTLQHLTLFLAAQQAGNPNKMASEYAAILEASGCGNDCGCSGDTPVAVPITPGVLNNIYNLTSGTGTILITPVLTPGVTTWDININPAILSILSNIGTTTVTTNTPAYLTVTQTGAAPNYVYQVDFNANNLFTINQVSKLLIIDPALNTNLNYLEFINYPIVNQGPNVEIIGNQTVLLGTTVPNQPTDPAVFFITGLFDTNLRSIVQANVMRTDDTISFTNVKNLEAEVFYTDSDTNSSNIYIRFYNPVTGAPYTLADLNSGTWGRIFLSVNIIA